MVFERNNQIDYKNSDSYLVHNLKKKHSLLFKMHVLIEPQSEKTTDRSY